MFRVRLHRACKTRIQSCIKGCPCLSKTISNSHDKSWVGRKPLNPENPKNYDGSNSPERKKEIWVLSAFGGKCVESRGFWFDKNVRERNIGEKAKKMSSWNGDLLKLITKCIRSWLLGKRIQDILALRKIAQHLTRDQGILTFFSVWNLSLEMRKIWHVRREGIQ